MYMNTQTINIVLPRELLMLADKRAKKEFSNRSELLRIALLRYLRDLDEWEDIFSYGKKIGKNAGIKSEAEVDKIVYDFRHSR